jgi:hypothetical protein
VLRFASGQRADVVLAAGGAERYRWSRGRMFAAVLVSQELAPGVEWTSRSRTTLSRCPRGRTPSALT